MAEIAPSRHLGKHFDAHGPEGNATLDAYRRTALLEPVFKPRHRATKASPPSPTTPFTPA